MTGVSIVVPTIGRDSLRALLDSLARATTTPFDELIVVDDRKHATPALEISVNGRVARRVTVLRSGGRGPARARNVGWRHASSEWICFLDDDVVVAADWPAALQRDLKRDPAIAGSQGCVEVPLPPDRAPSDWERNVAGLAASSWITADMAYRQSALECAGGFDERFPRAYREDADLALRVIESGGLLVRGTRRVMHPVRRADRWVSVRLQRGNADDVLMAALHGRDWRRRCGAPRGTFALHAAIVATSLVWLALVGGFAYRRIAPGPRTPDEVATMLVTSAAIPYAAVYHRLRARLLLRRHLRWAS